MMFQAQKRTYRPANVVALCPRTAHRTAFDSTMLLQPAMIALNRPDLLCRRGTLVHRHPLVARRPVFCVTVWDVNPKHQDKAIAFEMHPRPRFADGTLRKCAIARSVWVNLTIAFQAAEPVPVIRTDGLEIGQRAVPSIEGDLVRLKPTLFGGRQHGQEMVIFAAAVEGLVKQAIVAGDGVCTITPQERHQIDALDHAMMLARPVPMHQFAALRVRFVEGGVVGDQQAPPTVDQRCSFAPEWQGIRFQALQQAGEGVMRGAAWAVGLHPGGFGTRDHLWCGDQKVDRVEISHFGCIHSRMIPHNPPTA